MTSQSVCATAVDDQDDTDPGEGAVDTKIDDIRDVILDAVLGVRKDIKLIGERLEGLEGRQGFVEGQLQEIIAGMTMVRESQRSFIDRLSSVEKFCVEQPLPSETPPPYPLADGKADE